MRSSLALIFIFVFHLTKSDLYNIQPSQVVWYISSFAYTEENGRTLNPLISIFVFKDGGGASDK